MYFYKKKQKNILSYKIPVLLLILFIFKINFVNAGLVENSQAKISKENVIALVNLEREKRGVEHLKENKILNKVAQSKLNDMIEDDYFAHTSPKGVDPWEWFAKEGYQFEYAGENLAMNFKNVKDQHEAWMESSLHKKNILDGRFTSIGIAVSEKMIKNEKYFVTVQVFGTPEKNVIKSTNFTPQTFYSPSEIVYADLDDEILDLNDKKDICNYNCKYSNLIWIILIILTLIVGFVEYKFFVNSNK